MNAPNSVVRPKQTANAKRDFPMPENDTQETDRESSAALSQKSTACPECGTTGEVHGLSPKGPISVQCQQCGGIGYIPIEMVEWIDHGERLRDYRVNALQQGLRDTAIMIGIKPSQLSAIECGMINNLHVAY